MLTRLRSGNFGTWGGLFSTYDCAIKGIRKKEDPYNAIMAGFMTGGSLAMRGGIRAARNGAIGCAVLLAVIEGVGIGFQKMLAGSTKLEVSATMAVRDSCGDEITNGSCVPGTTAPRVERTGCRIDDAVLCVRRTCVPHLPSVPARATSWVHVYFIVVL